MTKERKTIITPWGRAVWPSLHEKDTKGDYPSNKYKVSIEPIDEREFARFKDKLKELLSTEVFKKKNPRGAIKELEDGRSLINLKSEYKPLGVDSKNHPLPDGTIVGGGSIIRANGLVYNYGDGWSLILLNYQVRELKTYETEVPFDTFDDGYEVDEDGDFGSPGVTLDI